MLLLFFTRSLMTSSLAMEGSGFDETNVYQERFPKRIQYLCLLSLCLTSIGDGVELYLPSVITQSSSCELQLSSSQENVLGLTLYVSAGITIFFVIPLSNKLGRRPLLLSSLYLSIAATIFCAVVPNYISLVASRIFLGIVIAINFSTGNVYISEVAGSMKFYVLAISLGTAAYHLGAGWCGVVAYLFLEQIGWRYFIVITSIPFFIISLLLLQFVLPESKHPDMENKEHDEATHLTGDNNSNGIPHIPRGLACLRISKILFYIFASVTPWQGSIMLIPSVVRTRNIESNQTYMCSSIIGSQFLLITLMFGICQGVGAFLCYLLHGRLRSPTILSFFSLVSIIIHVLMLLFNSNTMIFFVLLAVLQLMVSIPINEIKILSTDRTLFGNKYLALSSGLEMASFCLVIAIGNAISETLNYVLVLKVFLVFSVCGFPAGLSFYWN